MSYIAQGTFYSSHSLVRVQWCRLLTYRLQNTELTYRHMGLFFPAYLNHTTVHLYSLSKGRVKSSMNLAMQVQSCRMLWGG